MSRLLLFNGGDSGGNRPAPRQLAAITPPDAGDSSGQVHTALPPEQVIPARGEDPAWLLGDFGGLTLQGDYTPCFKRPDGSYDEPRHSQAIIANGGVRMINGPWQGLFVEFLPQANTTPPTALMSPMVPMYKLDVQVAYLTETCWRDYDDIAMVPDGWAFDVNGRLDLLAPTELVKTASLYRDWGLRPVLWRGDPHQEVAGALEALTREGLISAYVHGKEVDSAMTAEDYYASVLRVDDYVQGRFPCFAHFSAEGDRDSHHYGMGYPLGAPRDTFINDWSPLDGRWHVALQLGSDASAGLQGAAMYYCRRWVNLGGHSGVDGATGPGAPNSRVCAFETSQTAQLYGRMTEEDGCRRSLELVCGTRDNPLVRPVSGSMSGLRDWTGKPIRQRAA